MNYYEQPTSLSFSHINMLGVFTLRAVPVMFANRCFSWGHVSARRQRRIEARGRKWTLTGMRPHRQTFLAPWSSLGPRQSSSCATHKESEQHITAAARSAGYLLAVSSSGQGHSIDRTHVGETFHLKTFDFLGASIVSVSRVRSHLGLT